MYVGADGESDTRTVSSQDMGYCERVTETPTRRTQWPSAPDPLEDDQGGDLAARQRHPDVTSRGCGVLGPFSGPEMCTEQLYCSHDAEGAERDLREAEEHGGTAQQEGMGSSHSFTSLARPLHPTAEWVWLLRELAVLVPVAGTRHRPSGM